MEQVTAGIASLTLNKEMEAKNDTLFASCVMTKADKIAILSRMEEGICDRKS